MCLKYAIPVLACCGAATTYWAYIKEKLGIGVGETTADGLFTLKTAECLGACGYAPMMQMGKYYKEHLTKEKIDRIIEECRTQAAANN